ncbi:helix-turn-helix domain-containing protein [Sedimentibacter sp. zth1]|uniref:helix-turn-helix transcriptional regulator n=1 Tax=Sedimentibacter sp. zth1 TaxID=2816908 RepID=UPI001A921DD7|nr:helix-turn-helix transcriptional regulator [Sedimentibacter sp. zth1]QSX06159.1 helix-turn-helix domain-containing protein [Sedimentibacter sp. zth1]
MNGNKLRNLRKEKEYTIEYLANLSGFTASYISQIERNKIEPSLSALNKICDILNVSLYYFIEDDSKKTNIIRSEQRKVITSKDKKSFSFLTPLGGEGGFNPKFYVYEIKLSQNEWDSETEHILSCHKCIIAKKGTVLIEFSDHNELIITGDSIYINSNIPHRCYNPTDQEIEVMCILSELDLS